MLRAGHRSERGAKGGVAVAKLAEAAKTTREMARRYVNGEAFPTVDRLDRIATWLKIGVPWLRDGEKANVLEQPARPYKALSDEALEIARAWELLPQDLQVAYRSMIFTDAVVHRSLPWLSRHRPEGERYRDFERGIQRDFEKLGAQLPLDLIDS